MNHNEQLFDRFEGLTFDDVVLVPGFSDVLPDQVDTATTFARDIVLSAPLVSAAMDRVTEARLAIAWRVAAASAWCIAISPSKTKQQKCRR